ncbi:MAG: septum formation initiator family protein [Campylobacterota bacterium]|nr:septum formation initiator family protein [Campylobacterota bacterium]
MQSLKENKNFIITAVLLTVVTFALAYYFANLLFYGKNSYEVYKELQSKKVNLQANIKRLQYENASLQKQYLELKNLEPEEL